MSPFPTYTYNDIFYAYMYLEPEGCIEGSVHLSNGDVEQEGIPEVCQKGMGRYL